MTRVTSIGMGRKTFVASAAEESQKPTSDTPVAGPSKEKSNFQKGKDKKGKKRPRDEEGGGSGGGWKRDPAIAKATKDNAIKSAERRINRQNLNTSSTTCFACRNVGHAARDCPNVLLAAQGISNDGTAALLEGGGEAEDGKSANMGMKRGKGRSGGDVTGGGKCYRCNSTQHSLGNCPQKPDFANPTPFATCFICLATGHLSALCPSNTKGVYVKGGSCKVCGSVQHRANDCPDDKREKRRKTYDDAPPAPVNPADVGADEDDFMIKAQAEIKAAAAAARLKEEMKGRKKKHPPNNNGPREKYRKIEGEEGGAADLLAEGAPPQKTLRKAAAIKEQVDVPAAVASAALPDQPPAVSAPTPAPVKRSKPKVVKF